MKVYEVECGAVITITAQDMQKAALHGAAAIKDNPHLIYVRAVHERNLEPARQDPSAKTIRPSWRRSSPPYRGDKHLLTWAEIASRQNHEKSGKPHSENYDHRRRESEKAARLEATQFSRDL